MAAAADDASAMIPFSAWRLSDVYQGLRGLSNQSAVAKKAFNSRYRLSHRVFQRHQAARLNQRTAACKSHNLFQQGVGVLQ
jgi:hypothetical protein